MAGNRNEKGEGGKGVRNKEGKKEEKLFSSTKPSQQESNQFNSISSEPCKKGAELSVENNNLRASLFLSSSA